MQNSAIMKFELLKILIITPQYLTSITQDLNTQADFLNALKMNQYAPEQLLELIHTTTDRQAKSLLITQLLSLKAYLERLTEQPLIERLTDTTQRIPSRLNQLVHQMSIGHLTPAHIKDLQPEAAISILCSIPHFHLLKKEQIGALIEKYPKPSLIQYWVTHYSLMPNAFFIFAHLSKLFDMHVLSAVQQLDKQQQEHLIDNAIERLDLFNPDFKLLYEGDKEKHLVQAIKQYLYGKNHPHYIFYIHRLTNILLNQNTPLSLETIKHILSLHGIKEFSDLIKKKSTLINYYLRTQAHAGETRLFYNGDQLNSNMINLIVQLKKPEPIKTEERGFLHSWLHPTTDKHTEQTNDKTIPENALIQQLATQGKSIKAIDYYLLHFKGNSEDVSRLIQNYLSFYLKEGCTESRRQLLHLTAILINRTELKRSVREALYTSLLLFPELHDEPIRGWLFKYNAERTIKHFGHQGGVNNYQLVIELCTEALKKLIPQRDDYQIKIANQALAEAQLEIEFSENTGFFSRLFHRLIRCWKCGWTGFFSPNLPTYVLPFYTESKDEPLSYRPTSQEVITTIPKPETALLQIVTELENKRTLDALNHLVEMLSTIPLIIPQADALTLRARINNLFHEVINESLHNKEIESWLIKNKPSLETNQFHLFELKLQQHTQIDREQLKKQIRDESSLQSLLNELSSILPELPEEIKADEKASEVVADDAIHLERVSEMVNNAWRWAKGVGVFFAPPPLISAPPIDPHRSTPQ